MTKIDAVNIMLEYIGELPVPTSTTLSALPEGHEARRALTILERTAREEQEKELWFNVFNLKLVPNLDGDIVLPPNFIGHMDSRYFSEGNMLYKRADISEKFTAPLELRARLSIDFQDLPESFRSYVIYTGAKRLNNTLNGDPDTLRDLEENIARSWSRVHREHLAVTRGTTLSDTRLTDRNRLPRTVGR